MQKFYESIFAILLFCIAFLIFSGCVTVRPEYCNVDGQQVLCGTGSTVEEVTNACKASAQIPNGYSFCTGKKDCAQLFESILQKNLVYIDETQELYSKQSKAGLVDAWVSSNAAANFIANVRADCDNLFDFLAKSDIDILKNKKIEYEKNITNMKKSYEQYHKYHVLEMYYTKVYLESQNISALSGTQLFEKYSELTDLFNDYYAKLDKNLIVKETYISQDARFYAEYFGENKSNIATLFEDSSSYSKCLLENNYDSELCYSKEYRKEGTEFTEDILEYMLGANLGITGFVAGALFFMAYPAIGNMLVGAVFSADYVGGWTKNILKNLNAVTDIDEWKNVSYGKETLEDFEQTYGPSSDIFEYYILMNSINQEFITFKESMDDKHNVLSKQINLILQQLQKKNEYYILNKVLLQKFVSLDFDTSKKEELKYFIARLEFIKTEPLGTRYLEYKDIESFLSELNEYILTLDSVNNDYLILKCDEYVSSLEQKSKINEDYKLDYYKHAKSTNEKLVACKELIKNYSPDYYNKCTSVLNKLSKNYDYSFDGVCDLQYISDDLIETAQYNVLNAEYQELIKYFDNLQKMKSNSNCIKYKDIEAIDAYISSLYLSDQYFENPVLNKMVSDDKDKLFLELKQNKEKAIDLFESKLGCYFSQNYYIAQNKLVFDNPFGIINSAFDVSIDVSEIISEIVQENCLQSSIVKEKNILLKFKCTDNSMQYTIEPKEFELSNTIKIVLATMNSAKLEQEYCFFNNSNEIQIPLPTTSDRVLQIKTYYNTRELSNRLTENKLIVSTSSLLSKKYCLNNYYDVDSPIDLDYFVIQTKDNNILSYNYSVVVKNTLDYDLKNIVVYFPSSGLVITNNIKGTDLDYTEYNIKQINDNFVFKINSLLSNEQKTISFEIAVLQSEEQISEDILKLIRDLNEYNGISDNVLKARIKELITKLKDLSKSDKSADEKAKELISLQKESYGIIEKSRSISELDAQYLLLRDNLLKSKSNLQKYYDVLQTKYYKYAEMPLEKYELALNTALNDADAEFKSGNVREAIKIINKYNGKDSIILAFSQVFNGLKSVAKSNLKNIAKLNIMTDLKTQISLQDQKLSLAITRGDLEQVVQDLDNYNSLILESQNLINLEINARVSDNDSLINMFLDAQKSHLEANKILNKLSTECNSDNFDKLKSLGFSIAFTKKEVEKLETKSQGFDKDITVQNRDLNLYKQKLLGNDVDAVVSFEASTLYSLLQELQDFDIKISENYNSLKSLAEKTMVDATNKYKTDWPINLYKAKEYYDKGQYVDAIYYAKISMLATKNTNNSYYWIIGIVFFVVLILVFIGYKKLIVRTDGKKKRKRVTYYTVNKDD